MFKHIVSSNDVFLGMDFEKDSSSTGSDAITVRIELPKCNDPASINVDITAKNLALTSKE
jgi:hypothetical protein